MGWNTPVAATAGGQPGGAGDSAAAALTSAGDGERCGAAGPGPLGQDRRPELAGSSAKVKQSGEAVAKSTSYDANPAEGSSRGMRNGRATCASVQPYAQE